MAVDCLPCRRRNVRNIVGRKAYSSAVFVVKISQNKWPASGKKPVEVGEIGRAVELWSWYFGQWVQESVICTISSEHGERLRVRQSYFPFSLYTRSHGAAWLASAKNHQVSGKLTRNMASAARISTLSTADGKRPRCTLSRAIAGYFDLWRGRKVADLRETLLGPPSFIRSLPRRLCFGVPKDQGCQATRVKTWGRGDTR